MSGLTGAAIGIGAASTLGSALIQSNAAGNATDAQAAQAAANAAALNAAGIRADDIQVLAGKQGDDLLRTSGLTADGLLAGAYQGAYNDMRPYDSLGLKGSNALARYMGLIPDFARPKPKPPAAPPKGATPKAMAAYNKAQAAYQTNLKAWDTARVTHNQAYRRAADFGGYTRRYNRADLMRDPVYQTELTENIRAWDQSAAARGMLMSGNTVAGLRDLTAAAIGRGYDRDFNERNRKYNALAGLQNMGLGVRTGLASLRGQTASARANAALGTGSARANMAHGLGLNRANIMLDAAGRQAQYNQQAGDARATGQLAQGTAWGNAFGNVGQLAMLYGLGAFGQAGPPKQAGSGWSS